MNWQVQKWAFPLGFLYRKRVLACSRSRLFNFRLLFAPANCFEIIYQIRDFRGHFLNFWLFIKKKRCIQFKLIKIVEYFIFYKSWFFWPQTTQFDKSINLLCLFFFFEFFLNIWIFVISIFLQLAQYMSIVTYNQAILF